VSQSFWWCSSSSRTLKLRIEAMWRVFEEVL